MFATLGELFDSATCFSTSCVSATDCNPTQNHPPDYSPSSRRRCFSIWFSRVRLLTSAWKNAASSRLPNGKSMLSVLIDVDRILGDAALLGVLDLLRSAALRGKCDATGDLDMEPAAADAEEVDAPCGSGGGAIIKLEALRCSDDKGVDSLVAPLPVLASPRAVCSC